ncbi:MAG: hypothetical protein QXP28_00595, partial [Archaeoglobaceae archaeon]
MDFFYSEKFFPSKVSLKYYRVFLAFLTTSSHSLSTSTPSKLRLTSFKGSSQNSEEENKGYIVKIPNLGKKLDSYNPSLKK